MAILMLVGLVLIVLLHCHALYISRKGRTSAHTAAFWGGILGVVSIPVAILAGLAYLPFSITGAGGHPIGWILPASWIAVLILGGWSLVATLLAKRRRSDCG